MQCHFSKLAGQTHWMLSMLCFVLGCLFLVFEKQTRVKQNCIFLAPKAIEFIFEAFRLRGILKDYYKPEYVYMLTKGIALGLLAINCGIDEPSEKKNQMKGLVTNGLKWMWTVDDCYEDDNET